VLGTWSEESDGVSSVFLPFATGANDPAHPRPLNNDAIQTHPGPRCCFLIYTLEASCIFYQVAADMCYEDQVDYEWRPDDTPPVDSDSKAVIERTPKCSE
jgi:hypothetical protein